MICLESYYDPSGCCVENELFGMKKKAGMVQVGDSAG